MMNNENKCELCGRTKPLKEIKSLETTTLICVDSKGCQLYQANQLNARKVEAVIEKKIEEKKIGKAVFDGFVLKNWSL